MHARLEHLQKEVKVVQEQQTYLSQQRAELAFEKDKLANAIKEAEEQKRKYTGSKLQQQRESQKIDELKNQVRVIKNVKFC